MRSGRRGSGLRRSGGAFPNILTLSTRWWQTRIGAKAEWRAPKRVLGCEILLVADADRG